MKRSKARTHVDDFFARLAERDPSPKTELVYTSPFTLLAAVMLSAQATDASVNKATPALFARADTPAKMAALGPEGILPYIKTIGLFRTKAKNLAALSQMLVDKHGGQVPADRELLQELPGVGRKTANVVLNAVFEQPTIAVDTHVFRVANRTGLAPGKDVTEVENALDKVVPDQWKMHAHHWLILHGRYTCTARLPKCPICPVEDLCAYELKTPVNPASITPRARTTTPAAPKTKVSRPRAAAASPKGTRGRG